MGAFQPGDVVIAQFFFTDMSATKKRPALIIACFTGADYLLCSITGVLRSRDPYQVPLGKGELSGGSLDRDSYIRPSLLMTIHEDLIHRKVGSLPALKLEQIREIMVNIIMGNACPT